MANMIEQLRSISWTLLTTLPHLLILCALNTQATNAPAKNNSDEQDLKACPDSKRVCTSLFRFSPLNTVKEGQYCTCPGCKDVVWDEEDGQSLTWYHYERSDWVVQYRFCERVIPKYQCKDHIDNVAIIRVHADTWKPLLKKIRCGCPKGKYYLDGWNKIHEGDNAYWDYTYSCHKPTCDLNGPCVRRYVDEARQKTEGFNFKCLCPEGMSCPLSTGPLKASEEALDESGRPYTNGFCKKLRTPGDPESLRRRHGEGRNVVSDHDEDEKHHNHGLYDKHQHTEQ